MQVIINGEKMEIESNLSLFELIKKLRIETKVMACAINMNIIKKEMWEDHILVENDKIEFLDFVGGG